MKNLAKKLGLGIVIIIIFSIFYACETKPTETINTESPKASESLQETESIAEFSMEDLVVGNLKYGDNAKEIEAAFGKPDSENSYQEGATGADLLEYVYSSGNEFVFIKTTDKDDFNKDDFIIRSVKIVSKDITTARGLKIGDSQDAVIKAFKNDGTDEKILYAAQIIETAENQRLIIPPRGIVSQEAYGEKRIVISYDVPMKPYNQDETYGYMFQEHGSIWFNIKDGVVVEYGWFVGAMAE